MPFAVSSKGKFNTSRYLAQDLTASVTAWQTWLTGDQGASPHTVSAYQRDLAAFLTALSERLDRPVRLTDLPGLTLADFQDYCDARLRRGHALSSVARVASTLRNFFRFLAAEGVACKPSIVQLTTPQIHMPHHPCLSASEAQRAVKTVAELSDAPWIAQRDAALLALMYGSGLRLGEVLALNWEQTPTGMTLTLISRGRSRTVPVLPVVPELLSGYLDSCPYAFRQGQPLFIGARGKRLNPGVVQRQIRRLRRVLSLPPGVTPRALRQAFANRLKEAGSRLEIIQQLMGHAHRATTRRHLDGS